MPQPLPISTRPGARIRRGLARLASVLTASLLIGVGSLAFAAPAHAAPVSDTVAGMTFEADDSDVAAGATVTDYTPGALDVAIPATVTLNSITYDVTAIGDDAFNGAGLTAVTIPDTVTSIGSEAFIFNALSTVTIPDSVTTIGPAAFGFNQLTELNLGSGITEIPQVAFIFNLLTELTVPDSVTTIGDAAFVFNRLQTVTMGSSVATIGGSAFYGNFAYDSQQQPDLTQYTAATATLKNVTFTGDAPTTITDITGNGIDPLGASFGPFDVLISYSWAFDADQVGGGFTSPTWKGYSSQAIAAVDFELNGHGTPIDSQYIIIDQTATEPTAPSASGFTFGGWFTDAALADEFSFGTAITADTTLYAGWDKIVIPPANAVVGFDMNGHGTQIPSQTVTVGEFATEPTEPTASGFAFTGWYTDADATNAFSFSTAITAATTLYAGWSENAVVPPTPEPTTGPPTTDTPNVPAVVKPTSTKTLASTGTASPAIPLLAAFAALVLGALLFARRRIRSN